MRRISACQQCLHVRHMLHDVDRLLLLLIPLVLWCSSTKLPLQPPSLPQRAAKPSAQATHAHSPCIMPQHSDVSPMHTKPLLASETH